MLQDKSLPEGEDGFPATQASSHAETVTGSPVLGVAGVSSTPLNSPQGPDPEQVGILFQRARLGRSNNHPLTPSQKRRGKDYYPTYPTWPGKYVICSFD